RREVSLEARLAALGRPVGVLDAGPGVEHAEIERLFAEATARLEALERSVEAAALQPGRPPELLVERLRPWLAMPGVPPRYRACLDRLRDGLGLPAGSGVPPEPEQSERVARAYR